MLFKWNSRFTTGVLKMDFPLYSKLCSLSRCGDQVLLVKVSSRSMRRRYKIPKICTFCQFLSERKLHKYLQWATFGALIKMLYLIHLSSLKTTDIECWPFKFPFFFFFLNSLLYWAIPFLVLFWMCTTSSIWCGSNKRPNTPLTMSTEPQSLTQHPRLRPIDTIQTLWVPSVKYITI